MFYLSTPPIKHKKSRLNLPAFLLNKTYVLTIYYFTGVTFTNTSIFGS